MSINGQMIFMDTDYDRRIFFNKTDPSRYDLRLHPQSLSSIRIGMKLLEINGINEKKSEFTATIDIYVSWIDERLSLIIDDDGKMINRLDVNHRILLDLESIDLQRIWKPELHVTNSISYEDILTSGHVHGTLNGNGEISLITKTPLTVNCRMNIKFYPFDYQKCFIAIESSKLSSRMLKLQWLTINNRSFDLISDNFYQDTNFHVECIKPSKAKINFNSIRSYDCVVLSIKFKRYVTYYLFNLYLPSTLLVISSWSSFWIHISAAPARVALVLTTMLTHVTSTRSIIDQLPNTSFICSLNIWIIICEIFIFAAIVEYATVNYFYTKPTRIQDKGHHRLQPHTPQQQTDINGNEIDPITDLESSLNNGCYKCDYLWHFMWQKILPPFDQSDQRFNTRAMAFRIDQRSRYTFPLAFIVFNAFYWTIVLIYRQTL